MASGALSAGTVTSNSINVNYSFSGCGIVALFMGGTKIKDCGQGSGSGSYTKTGLNPSTNYTFYLKHIPAP